MKSKKLCSESSSASSLLLTQYCPTAKLLAACTENDIIIKPATADRMERIWNATTFRKNEQMSIRSRPIYEHLYTLYRPL